MRRAVTTIALSVAALAAAVALPAAASLGHPAPGAAAAVATGPAGATARSAAGDPLEGVAEYLQTREGSVQVAVYDRATGSTHLLSDGPALPQYTASIVKADIMAMWLSRYQKKPAAIPAALPYSIQYLLQDMITISSNDAATGLFSFGGGCDTLTRFNRRIPLHDTEVGCETSTYYGWGNSTTTASDQAEVVKTFAYPNRVLEPDARQYGLHLMESIDPTQRWGVTCGPWGTQCEPPTYATPVPGVAVALKNGWKYVPTCPEQDAGCPWQINSMGWVHGDGRDYVLAVLTTDDPSSEQSGMDYGIATVQGVSKRVWENLG